MLSDVTWLDGEAYSGFAIRRRERHRDGHSLFVTVDGVALSCGKRTKSTAPPQSGYLGHGGDDNIYLPRRIEELSGVCVSAAAAGTAFSLFFDFDWRCVLVRLGNLRGARPRPLDLPVAAPRYSPSRAGAFYCFRRRP